MGQSARLGQVETKIEEYLKDNFDDWLPQVHAEMSDGDDWFIHVEIENWFGHDPSVGLRGGKEADAYFTIGPDGPNVVIGTSYPIEDEIKEEIRKAVEAAKETVYRIYFE